MRVIGLDHIVLNVADVERSLDFYCGTLGLEPVRVEEWRAGKAPFPSVRIDPGTIIDLFLQERTGDNMNHLCLEVEPLDWQEVIAAGGLEVVDGPGPRFGARGSGQSVYVADPDGNTVELRHYS
ncbi:catechol 2,3-dioxygenase-like lactoylglutathione lyase family enzyme [Streptacidiphilus sp. MAP12-16]|uniref:VOC family protein n=1 Tax=Streptacidiphilus sp. MAP12-16 TaxID=3156300 RepID=UPI003513C316